MALCSGRPLKLLLAQRCCRALCSAAEVGVFWDLNKCGVEELSKSGDAKASLDAFQVAPNIVKALRSDGFWGAISIRAYGNTRCFSNHRVTEALLATGVDLHHVCGGSNYLSKHLILDLLLWVRENSPPAHMLLISGSKEFSSVLHKLHMRGYNVLLAHPEGDISKDLCSVASKVWLWDEMMKGTGISVIPHYNCTPQSCMSNNIAQSPQLLNQEGQQNVDVNDDIMCGETKHIPTDIIPQEVVQQVLAIIRSRPSGFTLAAIRRQLAKADVTLDKGFYGRKDLLSFLLSLPDLTARLIWTSDKTRTFLFTENFTKSQNKNAYERDVVFCRPNDPKMTKEKVLEGDGNEVGTTSSDDSKKAKQEMIKTVQGERNTANACSQQDNELTDVDSGRVNILGASHVMDSFHESDTETLPRPASRGLSAASVLWNKVLPKLSTFKLWWFEQPHFLRLDNIYSTLPLTKKGNHIKPGKEVLADEVSYITLMSSSHPEDHKSCDQNSSIVNIEGDTDKVLYEGDGAESLKTEQSKL